MIKMTFLLVALLSLVSCENSGELGPEAELHKKQQTELESLQAELKELRSEVAGAKTKGPKKPIEELRMKLVESEAQLKELNAEFETIKAAEEKANQELADYKAKFKVK